MIIKNMACAVLFAFAGIAFAADESTALPQKMEGKWGRSGKQAEVELVQMESATKAKIKAIFWDGCTRRGETTAELKDGAWTFVVPGGPKFCEPITATMTQVPAKNRFEGTVESVYKGEAFKSQFYLEW